MDSYETQIHNLIIPTFPFSQRCSVKSLKRSSVRPIFYYNFCQAKNKASLKTHDKLLTARLKINKNVSCVVNASGTRIDFD